jgi:hypothetical protein
MTIFGPDARDLFSGDPIQDGHGIDLFARGLTAASRIEKRDDSTALLHFGKVDWAFPIPIEKKAEGWYFNTAAGKGAIIERRIRNNEEAAKMFTRQYVLAQWEYMRTEDGDKDGVAEFAQKFLSTPGKRDGLYWKTNPGEGASPLSPVIGYAQSQGYGRSPVNGHEGQQQPFQGYYYKILTRQGAESPDGVLDYMVNGNLVKGFALIAYPSRYGSSGRMTYLVSHLGKMYEKDLQAETAQIASQMTEFNPDSSWKLTQK